MKYCVKCLITKPLNHFRLMEKKYHLNKCKACYYEEKQNKLKSNPLTKKQKSEDNKRYRLKNKDKIYQIQMIWNKNNKDKVKAYSKKTKLNNKASRHSEVVARRLAKMHRTPIWLNDFDKRKMKYMYQIAAMLTKLNNELWTVDHIIPLQGNIVSGLHVPKNLQLMRASENYSKRNKYEVSA